MRHCRLWKPLTGICAIATLVISCQAGTPRYHLDFETEEDLDALYWQCKTVFSLSDKYVTSGGKSLKVEFFPSPFPGIRLERFPSDWSSYRRLVFDAYNPEDRGISLDLRLDDKRDPHFDDRYNGKVWLNPGVNHISIPLDGLMTTGTSRHLDLGHMKKVILFMTNPRVVHIVFLDDLGFEK